MTSEQINERLAAIDSADAGPSIPRPLASSGKSLPYLGWWWRAVDWDVGRFWLSTMGDPAAGDGWRWGFCVNDKWDYGGVTCTELHSKVIRIAAVALATEPTSDTLEAFFTAVQLGGDLGDKDCAECHRSPGEKYDHYMTCSEWVEVGP